VTPGRIAYLIVSIALIVLGPLGAIACFCPQPIPLFYLGLWLVVGFAWTRAAFLAAHVVTGVMYAVTWIIVFTTGITDAGNHDRFMEHVYATSFGWTGAVALLTFGLAAAIEFGRRRRGLAGAGGASETA
jgi:hypothetical protein